jgi:hypothetical protein
VEEDWFDFQRFSKKKRYNAGNYEKPKAIDHGSQSRGYYLITKPH